MDIKEKRILVTVFTSGLILGVYALYVYNNYIAGNPAILNDFTFWGKAFLVLIPVTIVAQIILHIIFSIINKILTNEDDPVITDEMDRIIELKSIRISHWIFTLGFLASMSLLAMGKEPWVMFVMLIASGFVSSIISELSKIWYYRKGV